MIQNSTSQCQKQKYVPDSNSSLHSTQDIKNSKTTVSPATSKEENISQKYNDNQFTKSTPPKLLSSSYIYNNINKKQHIQNTHKLNQDKNQELQLFYSDQQEMFKKCFNHLQIFDENTCFEEDLSKLNQYINDQQIQQYQQQQRITFQEQQLYNYQKLISTLEQKCSNQQQISLDLKTISQGLTASQYNFNQQQVQQIQQLLELKKAEEEKNQLKILQKPDQEIHPDQQEFKQQIDILTNKNEYLNSKITQLTEVIKNQKTEINQEKLKYQYLSKKYEMFQNGLESITNEGHQLKYQLREARIKLSKSLNDLKFIRESVKLIFAMDSQINCETPFQQQVNEFVENYKIQKLRLEFIYECLRLKKKSISMDEFCSIVLQNFENK